MKQKSQRVRTKRLPAPPPRDAVDLSISDPITSLPLGAKAGGTARLTFDGYKLIWHGTGGATYTAFSGAADESLRENVADLGPTPQGKYAVDPANVQDLVPSDDWGSHRVKIEPYATTVDRMRDCFKLVRSGMYIHGGIVTGTKGCIELNDNAEEEAFFTKLKAYGTKIEIEVKYAGDREAKYEVAACPY
jgi:hypothetical protein